MLAKYTDYTYDANGNQTRQAFYNSAGPDDIWFTDDDKLNRYVDHAYDANGNKTRQVSYNSWSGGAGPDGTWFTGDDVPNGYAYDTNGNEIGIKQFNSTGADGIWFTDDDEISMEWALEGKTIANPEMLFEDQRT